MTNDKPRVLIEDWLPVAELGVESRRERAAANAVPPLNSLHVWWARRPIVASAAVVLAGLLPAWAETLQQEYPGIPEFTSEHAYRQWLFQLVGILGDPVFARRQLDAANAAGIKLAGNGYGYKQAYRNRVSRRDLDLLHRVLIGTWGELPTVADPTAGGGSIPWAAARLGLPTIANDLNPIAASVLRAGVEVSARRGYSIVSDLKHWGTVLAGRIKSRLEDFYPVEAGESVVAYIWANAVNCPRTGRLVPLLTDKWLRKSPGKEAAVRLVTELAGVSLREPRFEIVTGRDVDKVDAGRGFISGGRGVSPYDNLVIDSEYIQGEAQAGRMVQIPYAVSVRGPNRLRTFRAPTEADLEALLKAKTELLTVRDSWEASGFIPAGDVPEGLKTAEPLRFGMTKWSDLFTARQVLAHGSFAEEFSKIIPEIRKEAGEASDDLLLVLAMMHGKALNWNSRLASWDIGKQKVRSTFDTHNLAFKWTFAEFDAARALYPWCVDQLVYSYGGVATLMDETGERDIDYQDSLERSVQVHHGSATALPIADGSVAHICMDPPYYDNVMYAELSDFFYSWEKGTLGLLLPDYFNEELTDKDNEAVANSARFAAMGRRKKELADLDYETKMTAIFSEARRFLRDDGVLSVMFTHKRAEAWDTLGMGLLKSGFTIETSWPVNTEVEVSLHQANMNSASSTIMLVCRKRDNREGGNRVYLDDIEQDIREAARLAAQRFQHDGIEGVDLLLSTYGPTLSVISQNWPVYSSTPDEDGREVLLRPEDALDLARQEVVGLRRARLIGKAARVDEVTDFVLLAWDIFEAREFPFDTARLLALAVGGLDIDFLARAKVVTKSAGKVKLLSPHDRLRRGTESELPGVRPEATTFEYLIDAVDTALYVAEVDGMQAAQRFLDRHGYTTDGAFASTMQGLVNAIPRTKVKGSWVVPEAGLLDTLCTLYFPDVALPEEEELSALVSEPAATLFDLV
jgi:putative DNA methylase